VPQPVESRYWDWNPHYRQTGGGRGKLGVILEGALLGSALTGPNLKSVRVDEKSSATAEVCIEDPSVQPIGAAARTILPLQ